MTTTHDFAEFVQDMDYSDLSAEVANQTKQRILDAVGIALGAVGEEPVEIVRETVEELDKGEGACAIFGSSNAASPPEAAMINTALIRYLDYMDAILLPKQTPHPTDNIGSAIASAEYTGKSGRELIAGVAIAYEIHGELGEKAPSGFGWDQVQIIFSNTAVASKLLGLDYEQTRNAMGISIAEYNPLAVLRQYGHISMWKGIASANRARNAVYSAMLARNGLRGPVNAIEGPRGWKEQIQGRDFQVEFTDGERVLEVMTKKYMAGTHAQAALEGIEDLIEREDIEPSEIEGIHLLTYEKASSIMGNRPYPENRETADHSTQYALAVTALDGALGKDQYTLERIQREDVRQLFDNIVIESDRDLTLRYEKEGLQPYDITVRTSSGEEYFLEKRVYEGHPHTPMSWDRLEEKFHTLAAGVYDESRREAIVDRVRHLEEYQTSELTELLRAPSDSRA